MKFPSTHYGGLIQCMNHCKFTAGDVLVPFLGTSVILVVEVNNVKSHNERYRIDGSYEIVILSAEHDGKVRTYSHSFIESHFKNV